MRYPKAEGTLYNPRFEHDSCGVGFVADISGEKNRRVLDRALEAVVNVTHRGAVSADAKTGDGAGVLTQIPSSIFVPQAAALGATVANDGDLAVGVAFLPQDGAAQARRTLKGALHDCGLTVLGWRETPIDASIIGDQALASLPRIEHVLVTWPDAPSNEAFTSRLFLARKIAERRLAAEESACYIASLSNRLIVYKGMLVAPQLQTFYKDLDNPEYETALAVLHQRYSTNTFPSWERSQPFRMLGHNGEINTVDGNRNRIRAREIHAAVWADAAADLLPILQEDSSDSASLDNVLELLVLSGRDPLHAMAMLIPEAWENMPYMDPVLRAFYEYHACLTEPWDGPAAVAFTDGVVAAAVLDRNGLRPARYKIDDDNIFVMASEVGATYMDDAHVIEKGRLGPGQMIAVDTEQKALLRNDEIKARLAQRQPYGDWLSRKMVTVDSLKADADSVPATRATIPVQRAFAYTSEEAHLVLRPLYLDGVEPVGSLGDDTPLSILAHKPRQLYTYFRQRFAQVTNPPIDSYREQLVMSLYTYLGVRGSLLEETEEHAAQLRLADPDRRATRCDQGRGQPAPHRDALRAIPRGRGNGRAEACAGRGLCGGGERGGRRKHHADPERSRRGRRARSDPYAAGGRRCSPCAHPLTQTLADGHRCRGCGRAGDAPVRAAHRLRSQRYQPLHGIRDHQGLDHRGTRRRYRRGEGARHLHQDDRRAVAQDHVEDGHLHDYRLPRGADIRGGRLACRGYRAVLHGNAIVRGGHRFRRYRRRGARPARGRVRHT